MDPKGDHQNSDEEYESAPTSPNVSGLSSEAGDADNPGNVNLGDDCDPNIECLRPERFKEGILEQQDRKETVSQILTPCDKSVEIFQEESEELCAVKQEDTENTAVQQVETRNLDAVKREEAGDIAVQQEEAEIAEELCLVKEDKFQELCVVKQEETEELCSLKQGVVKTDNMDITKTDQLCSSNIGAKKIVSFNLDETDEPYLPKEVESSAVRTSMQEVTAELSSIKSGEFETSSSKELRSPKGPISPKENETLNRVKVQTTEDHCSLKKEEIIQAGEIEDLSPPKRDERKTSEPNPLKSEIIEPLSEWEQEFAQIFFQVARMDHKVRESCARAAFLSLKQGLETESSSQVGRDESNKSHQDLIDRNLDEDRGMKKKDRRVRSRTLSAKKKLPKVAKKEVKDLSKRDPSITRPLSSDQPSIIAAQKKESGSRSLTPTKQERSIILASLKKEVTGSLTSSESRHSTTMKSSKKQHIRSLTASEPKHSSVSATLKKEARSTMTSKAKKTSTTSATPIKEDRRSLKSIKPRHSSMSPTLTKEVRRSLTSSDPRHSSMSSASKDEDKLSSRSKEPSYPATSTPVQAENIRNVTPIESIPSTPLEPEIKDIQGLSRTAPEDSPSKSPSDMLPSIRSFLLEKLDAMQPSLASHSDPQEQKQKNLLWSVDFSRLQMPDEEDLPYGEDAFFESEYCRTSFEAVGFDDSWLLDSDPLNIDEMEDAISKWPTELKSQGELSNRMKKALDKITALKEKLAEKDERPKSASACLETDIDQKVETPKKKQPKKMKHHRHRRAASLSAAKPLEPIEAFEDPTRRKGKEGTSRKDAEDTAQASRQTVESGAPSPKDVALSSIKKQAETGSSATQMEEGETEPQPHIDRERLKTFMQNTLERRRLRAKGVKEDAAHASLDELNVVREFTRRMLDLQDELKARVEACLFNLAQLGRMARRARDIVGNFRGRIRDIVRGRPPTIRLVRRHVEELAVSTYAFHYNLCKAARHLDSRTNQYLEKVVSTSAGLEIESRTGCKAREIVDQVKVCLGGLIAEVEHILQEFQTSSPKSGGSARRAAGAEGPKDLDALEKEHREEAVAPKSGIKGSDSVQLQLKEEGPGEIVVSMTKQKIDVKPDSIEREIRRLKSDAELLLKLVLEMEKALGKREEASNA